MKTFAHLSRNTTDIDIEALLREIRRPGRRWTAIKRQSSFFSDIILISIKMKV
jgi:aspartyl/asparaginyl beta-hydroxylase (cupin superfamily)